jgi:hypothetical protein
MRGLDARVIRHQFRRNGLVHLVVCKDNAPEDPEYHVVFGPIFCDKEVPIGSGGWGHGPNRCPVCWKVGAPAERVG